MANRIYLNFRDKNTFSAILSTKNDLKTIKPNQNELEFLKCLCV